MKKICLVYPNEMKLPSYFRYATNISTDISETLPPLGMLYIIGNSKYDVDLIDNRIKQYDFKELLEILSQYDIIGFGGTIFEIKEARRLSTALKAKDKVTIYGGPNANVNWSLYLEYFDIIVRGEAELIFNKIIDNIDNLQTLGFSNINNTYVNLQAFRIVDLDQLKYPDRTKIDLSDYRRQELNNLGDVYPIDTVVSSRGCPFDCYFCSSKIIWDRKYTYRSVDNLINEIEFMMTKYGTRGIYFREDNFTIDKKRVMKFCQKIAQYNLVWMCESRVDTLDEELIEQMAKSGCKAIWFGIESTDDWVLKKIRKNVTLRQIKTIINLCNKYNIVTGGGFMLGFPFENKDSVIKNYKKAKQLNLKNIFYNRVWAIPRSDMYDQIIHEGLDYYSFENIILPGTRYLTADELNKLYYKLVSRKKVYLGILRKLIGKEKVKYLKKRFPNFYKWTIQLLKKI